MDLDINNYNLEEILQLFKLPINFDETQLKQAKQIVLKVHPDKSGLDAQYFIFYSKAYKMIYNIWEFRKKSYDDKEKNTEYSVDEEEDIGKSKILDQFLEKREMKDKKNFNKWFNQEFEKNKIASENESKGYGDWLKNEETSVGSEINKDNFASKKKEIREKTGTLIEYQEIQELNYSSSVACDLDSSAPATFSSSIFSSLQYEDLHKAHTETLIPVTEEEDFDKKHQFHSLDELKHHRNSQNIIPLSEQQAKQYLTNRGKMEDEKSVRVAYDLQKQLEKSKQNSNSFWKNLQLLNN